MTSSSRKSGKPSPPRRAKGHRPEPPPSPSRRAAAATRQVETSAPEIRVGYGPAGRETLAAIAEELVAEPATGIRTRIMSAVGFEESRERRPAQEPGPELVTEARPAGRDTLAAIERELESRLGDDEPHSDTLAQGAETALDVFEMVTFVARGPELSRLSSQQVRKDFVAERLMHRLPVGSIDEVDRIDVMPWTVHGTVIVRVWCRVPEVQAH